MDSSADDWLLFKSDFVSKTARQAKAQRLSGRADDMEVSDESQLLFLIDSHSGEPNTTIRAFDINGNFFPQYSVVIPKASLPVLAMGFTVIGINLYMFGGRCVDRRRVYAPVGEIAFSDTHTYILNIRDIPGALDSGKDLFQSIKPGPRMQQRKTLPIVFVAKQTLYVLSGYVHCYGHSSIDFESRRVDDDDDGDSSWAALPNPPFECPASDPHPFYVESHALVGDTSIVISLNPRLKGIFVFNLDRSRWTCVNTRESLCFIRQPILFSSGLYYALSPSGSELVLLQDVESACILAHGIREASPHVRCYTSHYIAAVDDVIFVFRTGSPSKDYTRQVYLTIDKYKVSGHSISEQGDTITYSYGSTASMCSLYSLYLIPVSLPSSK